MPRPCAKKDEKMAEAQAAHGSNEPRLRLAVADAVFAGSQPTTLQGLPRAGLLIALVFIGALVVALRTPPNMWNLLWAEDGAVFVSGALSDGPGVLFSGYAGYLHLVPRLAAEVALTFPLLIVPLVITLLSAAITSLLACACFVFLETRIRLIPLRFAAWVVCLALPTMGGDVANNLANMHWLLLIAAFCAVLTQSRSAPLALAQCLAVFGAATSDALAFLLLPLVLVRLWLLTKWRDRAVGLTFLAGAALQGVAVVEGLLGTGPARHIAEQYPNFAQLLDLYVNRVVVVGLFGIGNAQVAFDLVGASLPGLALAAVIAVVVSAVRLDGLRRVGIIVFTVSSFVFAAGVYSLQWYAIENSSPTEYLVGLRYAVVPTALLLIALLQAVDVRVACVQRTTLRRVVAIAAFVAVIVPVAADFRSTVSRESPAWEESLELGRDECVAGNAENGLVVIPTPPLTFGGMLIPCEVLGPPSAAAWSSKR